MADNSALRVVIIGAGVAGLATAYGLRKETSVRVRVIERRSLEECSAAGYPIHLSKDGRDSLKALLTPKDWDRVVKACEKIPTFHDGITVQKASGRITWRMVKSPGTRGMLERQELCSILRGGTGEIEYGRGVRFCRHVGRGWIVRLHDGEMLHADVLIGADGMFSAVRRALYPRSDTDGFKKLPWTTVNLCTSSPRMYDFIKDERGMNMMYGKGWSAAFMSLASPTPPSSQEPRSGSTYVALTIPSPVVQARESLERLEGEYIEALLVDPGLEDARAYPLYTSKRTIIGRDRALLIGDASHGMVPFCGAGASAGIRDAVDLAAFLNSVGENDLNSGLKTLNEAMRRRNDPLIKQSLKVLWLSQGETSWKRVARWVAFGYLEVDERLGGKRKRLERELEKVQT